MKEGEVKKAVREGYSRIAQQGGSCCGPDSTCGQADLAQTVSRAIGYSDDEMAEVPQGANLGLGCGNPVALAALHPGDIVLDLGSGAGFDCFLAAKRVGTEGRVIGVDMTPEMIARARENTSKGNYTNVEFRLGEIEHLPLADSSVDVVISNCVINLAPQKGQVFKEACRVLRPGGRLMVSDIVLLQELPEMIKNVMQAYVGCVAGAIKEADYLGEIEAAGFREITVLDRANFPIDYLTNDPAAQSIIQQLHIPPEEVNRIGSSVVSIQISAVKPETPS